MRKYEKLEIFKTLESQGDKDSKHWTQWPEREAAEERYQQNLKARV